MTDIKHTPGSLKLVVGEEYCFHDGNRVSIIKTREENGESRDETVAEVWRSSDDTDIADGEFIVKACNSFDNLVQELGDAIQLLETLNKDTLKFRKALDF